MRTVDVTNVSQALAHVPNLLQGSDKSNSRNGAVIDIGSLTTTYRNPFQRFLRSPTRDANPIFHLLESLWMLAGLSDTKSMARLVPSILTYGNPETGEFDGAYGKRWRYHFKIDQITAVVTELSKSPNSRRAVIGIYDAAIDTPRMATTKDLPCNLLIKFDIKNGRLNMYVFNRSNDIIFGAYGANAVHFSVLHEYVYRALRLTYADLQVGVYEQISADTHFYTNGLYGSKTEALSSPMTGDDVTDPYVSTDIHQAWETLDWFTLGVADPHEASVLMNLFNYELSVLPVTMDCAWNFDTPVTALPRHPFFAMVVIPLLSAYATFKSDDQDWDFITEVMGSLEAFSQRFLGNHQFDVLQASREWFLRRSTKKSGVLA